ncbi:MAG: hypothetical protein GX129_00710 [Clostridiales bacterium]|jgi:hypothetical protein|nr:hypothetical protein [Clostridiales bacterium]
MNNQFNFPGNEHKFTKGESEFKDTSRPSKNEPLNNKRDEDLIIEENTIYEIDRNCAERLKRNKRR